MSAKIITYSDHAAAMMAVRGLTAEDIRELFAHGWWSVERTTPGRDQRFSYRGPIRGRDAKVVYIETAREYHIVSAQWLWRPLPRREG